MPDQQTTKIEAIARQLTKAQRQALIGWESAWGVRCKSVTTALGLFEAGLIDSPHRRCKITPLGAQLFAFLKEKAINDRPANDRSGLGLQDVQAPQEALRFGIELES